MVMASTAFIPSTEATDTIPSRCFQTKSRQYQDFLQNNFDGTTNSSSPLAQIYMSSKANNEVYTLKEMLMQPDKELFMEAMEKEVSSMFQHKIWKTVPKKEMLQHY